MRVSCPEAGSCWPPCQRPAGPLCKGGCPLAAKCGSLPLVLGPQLGRAWCHLQGFGPAAEGPALLLGQDCSSLGLGLGPPPPCSWAVPAPVCLFPAGAEWGRLQLVPPAGAGGPGTAAVAAAVPGHPGRQARMQPPLLQPAPRNRAFPAQHVLSPLAFTSAPSACGGGSRGSAQSRASPDGAGICNSWFFCFCTCCNFSYSETFPIKAFFHASRGCMLPRRRSGGGAAPRAGPESRL